MNTSESTEARIAQWRQYLSRQQAIHDTDIDELEDHLRSHVETLRDAGLDEDEAFLVAIKRMGDIHSISREFSREYSERLWKQLLDPNTDADSSSGWQRDTITALGFAITAAVVIKLPTLFGMPFVDTPEAQYFYVRNISLFVLPVLAAFFAWKRGLGRSAQLLLAAPFVAGALVMNLLPFEKTGSTVLLSSLHLPIALWFAVGFAYMNGKWRNHIQRMNFVRFSGEWVIYLALIALGGGVLTVFTIFIFESIGMEAEGFVTTWLMPCGVAGAMVVSGWLVEAKQSIIENMAPVLTRLFTPLFALLLIAFLVTMAVNGVGILVNRDMLIGFDLLLLLILGLLLYSISARNPEAAPDLFDRLQFLLVLSALLVDILALWALGRRIAEFGFSPNKVAALGVNLLLLVNLGWSTVLYARFLWMRGTFAAVERWQTAYIPVYPIWAGIVVALFPLIFQFQ